MPQNYGLGRGLSSLIPKNAQKSRKAEGNRVTSKKKMPSSNSLMQEDDSVYESIQKPVQTQDSAVTKSTGKVSSQGNEQDSMQSEGVREVNLSAIVANPHQPRKKFNDEKLQELSRSIQEHGIVQPLVVTKQENGGYELIAGERRMRAAQMAGLEKVPVVVKDIDDQQKLELAIIENIQRHDLDPIEEARAYQRLAEEFQLSQEEIAKKMGKSRSVVANTIRLLQLPLDIQKGVEEGKITEGHAKAILSLDNPEKQRALYELILRQHLTVRQTESKSQQVIGVRAHRRTVDQDPQLKAVENEMHELLGTKVKVKKQGNGVRISIEFYSKEEMLDFMNKIQ